MGAIVDRRHSDRIEAAIDTGRATSRLVSGGERQTSSDPDARNLALASL